MGGRLETGLGQALLSKGLDVTGRELTGEFRKLVFSDQVEAVANACSYCIHSHTASAISKGMSTAQHADLMRVIALAGKTNQLASALQLPVDAVFTKE